MIVFVFHNYAFETTFLGQCGWTWDLFGIICQNGHYLNSRPKKVSSRGTWNSQIQWEMWHFLYARRNVLGIHLCIFLPAQDFPAGSRSWRSAVQLDHGLCHRCHCCLWFTFLVYKTPRECLSSSLASLRSHCSDLLFTSWPEVSRNGKTDVQDGFIGLKPLITEQYVGRTWNA